MTVNLTRIYTKLGDSGDTHLGDMSRVSKLHPRVEAYGTVDELNATLGVALCAPGMPAQFAQWLQRIQNDLLDLGADLSVPAAPAGADGAGETSAVGEDAVEESAVGESAVEEGAVGAGAVGEGTIEESAVGAGAESRTADEPRARTRLRVTPQYTEWLEQVCDEVNATLEPLRSFVIPGGAPAAAQLHICRTVCRRAERRAIAAGEEGANPEVVRYLNRLSDLLFILARAANDDGPRAQESRSEPLWDPGAHGATP